MKTYFLVAFEVIFLFATLSNAFILGWFWVAYREQPNDSRQFPTPFVSLPISLAFAATIVAMITSVLTSNFPTRILVPIFPLALGLVLGVFRGREWYPRILKALARLNGKTH
ncbi:MAG: hypothetical protein KY429_11160 [Actinobacteria bacterium]|nr:hypothetical protein [Actinomycetota bacterium]